MHLELRIDSPIVFGWPFKTLLGSSHLPTFGRKVGVMGAGLASFSPRPEADTMELSVMVSLLCPANWLEFEAEAFWSVSFQLPLLFCCWGFGQRLGGGCLFYS